MGRLSGVSMVYAFQHSPTEAPDHASESTRHRYSPQRLITANDFKVCRSSRPQFWRKGCSPGRPPPLERNEPRDVPGHTN